MLLDSDGAELSEVYAPHRGRPLAALATCLRQLPVPLSRLCPPGLVGSGAVAAAELLDGLKLEEGSALSAALLSCPQRPAALLSLGAQSARLLLLDPSPKKSIIKSQIVAGPCAQGLVSLLERQAQRLGLDIKLLSRLALDSPGRLSLSPRCPVDLETSLSELALAGASDRDLAAALYQGAAQGLAHKLWSTLDGKEKKPSPLWVCGAPAQDPAWLRALSKSFRAQVEAAPQPHLLGARGAALEARRLGQAEAPGLDLAALNRALVPGAQKRRAVLPPLKPPSTYPTATVFDWAQVPYRIAIYLGLDLGSETLKLALVTEDGRLVFRRSRPVAGRPLKALADCLSELPRQVRDKVQVAGVCVTGAGRALAGPWLGADLSVDEFSAQAAAAAAMDLKADGILDLGGRQAKYIALTERQMSSFALAPSCGLNLGSFLASQAQRLGFDIKAEFAQAALAGRRPVQLSDRCLVQMEADLIEAQRRGEDPKDLAAGLCHALAAAYLNWAHPLLGQQVLVYGSQSLNQALISALEARLGRPLSVPDNADVAGAIGAALLARRERSWRLSRFKGFERWPEPEAAAPRPTEIQTESQEPPDCFSLREQWAFTPPELAQFQSSGRRLRRVALPRSLFLAQAAPFWSVFWAALGFEPLWSSPGFLAGAPRPGLCPPLALLDSQLAELKALKPDFIFLPSVADSNEIETLCPAYHELSRFAPTRREKNSSLWLTGPLLWAQGEEELGDSLAEILAPLKKTPEQISRAVALGLAAQRAYRRRLEDRGREIVAGLKEGQRALVLLDSLGHGFEPFWTEILRPRLSTLGLTVLPLDFLPLSPSERQPAAEPAEGEDVSAEAAAKFITEGGRLAAVGLSHFGCGFLEERLAFFRRRLGPGLWWDFELPGGGPAAWLDRLEALAACLKNPAPALEPAPEAQAPSRSSNLAQRYIFLPGRSDYDFILASALRAAGLKAENLPPAGAQSLELARGLSGGPLCLPLRLTLGSFIKVSRRPGFDPSKSLFLLPPAAGRCELDREGFYLSLLAQRPRLEGLELMTPALGEDLAKLLSALGRQGREIWRIYRQAATALELLQRALARVQPRQNRPGAAEAAYETALADLRAAVESRLPLKPVMRRARQRFEAASTQLGPASAPPSVRLTGPSCLRHNPWASAQTAAKLQELGLELELSYQSPDDLAALIDSTEPAAGLRARLVAWLDKWPRRRLTAVWRNFFPQPELPLAGPREPSSSNSSPGSSAFCGLEIRLSTFKCPRSRSLESLKNAFTDSGSGRVSLNLFFDGQSHNHNQKLLELLAEQLKSSDAPVEASEAPAPKGHQIKGGPQRPPEKIKEVM